MEEIVQNIVLRPRFQLNNSLSKELLLSSFEKNNNTSFLVNRIDDHVFIKFPKKEIHFWSPQLHLEINETEEGSSRIHGLFGPNPTLWTFFMFLHFGVASIFIVLGIWAYSSASLGHSYGLQIGLMVFMIIIWFTLYAFGRLGRSKGKPQMHQLHDFMNKTLEKAANKS